MSDAPPLHDLARAQKVWTWYVVYCVAMALMYGAVALMGVVFLVLDPDELQMHEEAARGMGTAFVAMGALLAVPFAIAPFLAKTGGTWIYGLVLIAVGLTSICCWPATIPLLIYWIKPETKALFGRS
jgi:hypothetical protein